MRQEVRVSFYFSGAEKVQLIDSSEERRRMVRRKGGEKKEKKERERRNKEERRVRGRTEKGKKGEWGRKSERRDPKNTTDMEGKGRERMRVDSGRSWVRVQYC